MATWQKSAALAWAVAWGLTHSASAQPGETLYNGIVLPSEWPPKEGRVSAQPPGQPPYLTAPPAVIPIDVGRQLFVDHFLIEDTDLRRSFHAPEYFPGNPILQPDQPWEKRDDGAGAMPFSDGVWYDPQDQLFKMWYASSPNTLYAVSQNGVDWEKPQLDVQAGTNVVHVAKRDSSTVWLDLEEKDPAKRFKFIYSNGHLRPLSLHFSPDGIHWGRPVAESPPAGDRTTAFWNPFRQVWVYSLREQTEGVIDRSDPNFKNKPPGVAVRYRAYREHRDIVAGMQWNKGEPVVWSWADHLDQNRIDLATRPELYNVDAVAYESLILGLFTIWRGQFAKHEKPNQLTVAFSRDGFHWDRPFRQTFLPVTGREDDWNEANVQSAGGVCLIVGDRLYFYVSGRKGRAGSGRPAVSSAGLATLRRDGFASMDAGSRRGTLTTRPVRFSGRHLFVNVAATAGELRVEVLDAQGSVIAPFTRANSVPIRGDNTLQPVTWTGGDLGMLSGQPVKFRFHLQHGRLYSFWVSPAASGASHGYVAAGGPGFTGPIDTVGSAVYENCCAGRIRH